MEHKTTATENHGRYGTAYTASCVCGWKIVGFEYWTQADRARHGHDAEVSSADVVQGRGNGRYR